MPGNNATAWNIRPPPTLARSDCGDLIRSCQRHVKGFAPNGKRCHGVGRRNRRCAAAASDRDRQRCRAISPDTNIGLVFLGLHCLLKGFLIFGRPFLS
jgi:hypothetical protein